MVTANKQHASGVHRHNLLCRETDIIPLLEERADETVINKRIKWRENSVSISHNEISKIVDSESQYQGMCWNILIKIFILPFIYFCG